MLLVSAHVTHFGLRRRRAEARYSSAPRRAEQSGSREACQIVSCPMVLGYDPCKSRPPPAYLEALLPFPLFSFCAHSVTPSLFYAPILSPLRPCVFREKSALRLRFASAAACILEMKEAPRRCCFVAEEQACGKSRAQNVRQHSKWPLGGIIRLCAEVDCVGQSGAID
ncbi:hypothetical protein GGI35DRAFT_211598 [Trichoderma velutinum]